MTPSAEWYPAAGDMGTQTCSGSFWLGLSKFFTQLHRTRDYSQDQSWTIEMPLAHWVDSTANIVRMGQLHSIKSGTIPSKTKLLSHQYFCSLAELDKLPYPLGIPPSGPKSIFFQSINMIISTTTTTPCLNTSKWLPIAQNP